MKLTLIIVFSLLIIGVLLVVFDVGGILSYLSTYTFLAPFFTTIISAVESVVSMVKEFPTTFYFLVFFAFCALFVFVLTLVFKEDDQ